MCICIVSKFSVISKSFSLGVLNLFLLKTFLKGLTMSCNKSLFKLQETIQRNKRDVIKFNDQLNTLLMYLNKQFSMQCIILIPNFEIIYAVSIHLNNRNNYNNYLFHFSIWFYAYLNYLLTTTVIRHCLLGCQTIPHLEGNLSLPNRLLFIRRVRLYSNSNNIN